MDLFQAAAAFTVVAGRAGRHNVRPDMLASLMAGLDVINCKASIAPTAVLAGIIIAPEDFAAGQLYAGPGTVDLFLQAYDRWPRQQLRNSTDMAAAIYDQVSLPHEDQANGPAC